MKSVLAGGFASSVVVALFCLAPAFAASSATMVQVGLDGEAGQPMKIVVDKPSVKAGLIDFNVKNLAIGTDHEVVLIKVANKGVKIAADAKTHRIDEAKLKSMGEVGGLTPGAEGHLKVKLAAGDYILICNHKEHYELGMATAFTVTK